MIIRLSLRPLMEYHQHFQAKTMKKMKHIFLMLFVLFQFVQPKPDGFIIIAPLTFGAEETVCIDFKRFVSNLNVTAEILEEDTNKQLAVTSIILDKNFKCFLLNVGKLGSYAPSSARLVVRAIDDLHKSAAVIRSRRIMLDTEVFKVAESTELDEEMMDPRPQLKKKTYKKVVPDWERDNLEHEKLDRRNRRDIEFSQRFSTFADKSVDLEVPNQIPGTYQVFALPPTAKKEQEKCPQCLKKVNDDFPKLYCSSQLSAKIKLRGRDVMYVLQDLSPHRNATDLRRMVSYTMKRRCECDFVENEESILLMLVTPPRKFNLESIQVVHLDESISLFPWRSAERYLSRIESSSCTDILTMK